MIYTVEATDLDGDNVSYYIPPNSLNSDKFVVDSETGEVFTEAGVVLDREVGCRSHSGVTSLLVSPGAGAR